MEEKKRNNPVEQEDERCRGRNKSNKKKKQNI
jgi:hypothetical protein